MAYIIYPKCTTDDIRIQWIDVMNPYSQYKLRPLPPAEACKICAPGKRIIAIGNFFDGQGKEK